MNGITQPNYVPKRGGIHGPSKPTITITVNGKPLDLYDARTISLQFGCTVKNVRSHAARGHYGTPHIVNRQQFFEKKIVDQFKPDPRGPKPGKAAKPKPKAAKPKPKK